jgi:hypothetical protein
MPFKNTRVAGKVDVFSKMARNRDWHTKTLIYTGVGAHDSRITTSHIMADYIR